MLKKLLLASTAGFILGTGALYAGAAWSQEARFVFRYASGVLPVAAGGSDTENPGDGDDETGETDPDDEEGEPDEGDDEGEDDGDPEIGALPSDIELSAPVLVLLDHGFDGYAHPGDILAMRFVARNRSTHGAPSARVQLAFPYGDQEHTATCELRSLSQNEGDECNVNLYLTPAIIAALGEPDAIVDYRAFGSLIGLGGDAFPADAYRVESNEISFMLPAPVTAEHIVMSAPTLALLDADGDGSGDAGEVVRMTFKATNIGSGPAENVGFVTRFPADAEDPRSCDFASIAASASATCQGNFVLTQDFLDGLGEPGTAVSLGGSASLVSLNGLAYAEGEYAESFGLVSFTLPTPETVAYLRLTYSGGWVFECRTDWSPQFLADNIEMTLVFYDRVKKVFIVPGMDFKHTSPTALSLRSSWFLISTANYGTMTATVGGFLTPTGDPRGKQITSSDGKACSDSSAKIIAVGDLTTSYRIEIESAELVERVE